jgi:hypothetical protein
MAGKKGGQNSRRRREQKEIKAARTDVNTRQIALLNPLYIKIISRLQRERGGQKPTAKGGGMKNKYNKTICKTTKYQPNKQQ